MQDDLLVAQARRQGGKPEVGRDFRHGSGLQGIVDRTGSPVSPGRRPRRDADDNPWSRC